MPSESTNLTISKLGADSEYAYYLKHVEDWLSKSSAESVEGVVSKCTQDYQNYTLGENDFQVIWGPFSDLARDAPARDDPTQDKLVQLLGSIKAKGALKRKSKNGSGEEECETWGGKAWTDLPMFGAHMRESMDTDSPSQSSSAIYANTNAFVARITAAGIKDFSLYAIWALRAALEDARPPTMRETSNGETKPKSLAELPVDELLPAALEWFEHCGKYLMKLTQDGKTFTSGGGRPDSSKLGKLAIDAGLEKSGFNVERWKFWEQRLEKISKSTNDAGGKDKVAKLAYQGLEKMKSLHN